MKTVQAETKKIEAENKQEESSKNTPEEFRTPESICNTENKNITTSDPSGRIVIYVDNVVVMQDTENTPVLKKKQSASH